MRVHSTGQWFSRVDTIEAGWLSRSPNDGMALMATVNSTFSSSEATTPTLRPSLQVCYSLASCSDGVQDAGETGVDCGGPCAPCVVPPCAGTLGLPGVPSPLVGSAPFSVAAGDLNGDGRTDLVTANSGTNDVSVLFGQGNGTFAPAVSYAAGTNPVSIAIADLNGDGRLDLAVTNSVSNDVSVLLNQGNGTFAPAVNHGAGANPHSIAVADLDGDGKLDLVVVNQSNSTVGALFNQGNGTFSAPVAYSVGSTPQSVSAADLNGDGKPNLAITNINSDSALLNQGNGTFAPATSYPAGTNPEGMVAAACRVT